MALTGAHLILSWPTAAFQPLCICSSDLGYNWCPSGSLTDMVTRTHIHTRVQVVCRKEQSWGIPPLALSSLWKEKKKKKNKKFKKKKSSSRSNSRPGKQLFRLFSITPGRTRPLQSAVQIWLPHHTTQGGHSVISRHPPRGCWLHTWLCF